MTGVNALFPVAIVPLLLLFTLPEIMAHDQNSGTNLTVRTDKERYTVGETIVVSGTVARIVEGESLLFRLYNPLGALARADPVEVSYNGTYRYQFPTGGPTMAQPGEYRVVVNYGFQESEVIFELDQGTSDTWWTINIGGNPYVIRYQIFGGRIHAISGDPESKSITVTINATRDDGVMRLQFRRDIIQSQNATNGQDVPFIILIDGKVVNYTEAMTPATGTRELEIPFTAGQSKIEIIGTWLVPEFNAIAALTFGAAMPLIFLLLRAKRSHSRTSQHV
jgi:hypothetical protein